MKLLQQNIKKFSIIAFLLIMATLFFLPNQLSKVEAATDYKSIYSNFLQGNITCGNDTTELTNAYKVQFLLLNIDKKGAPELIIKNSASTFSTHYVYTIKNGNLSYCGNYPVRGEQNLYYNKKQKALGHWWWTNGIGGVGHILLKLNNKGSLYSHKYLYSSYKFPGSSKMVYYYGKDYAHKKKVSKSQFNNYCKQYGLGTTYQFSDNTTSNRVKILGQ